MPVRVVKEGASPASQVPPHLSRTPIPLLSPSMDCSDTTVEGKVLHKGPLVSLGDKDFLLKTVIEENGQQSLSSEDPSENGQHSLSSENTSINVILLGDLAKEFSESVSQGNVLVVSGFTVGKSPSAGRDQLHPCTLQLSGDDAWVYVFPSLPPSPRASLPPEPRASLPPEPRASLPPEPRASLPPDSRASASSKRTSPRSATKITKAAKVAKYSYVSLGDLQAGTVVNVYGVVIFFKQPFQTKGTDYCSTFKIIDQSNEKVGCTIFSNKLENHAQIFKMGDIIRLHRMKSQLFNGSMTLLTSFGFSVMTFDGAVGSPVVPRTSSRSYHFSEEDRQCVEALRSWAAGQTLLPPEASQALEALQPREAYFNLTCQLLARAAMDSTCTLLKVWDGTRCPHPLPKVFVEPHLLEGCSMWSQDVESLAVNVLVYDNHIEVAQQLQPGAYIRIYNLHVVPGTSKVPGNSTSKSDQLEFHLHGGTAYGRGIRVLPEDSPDVQKLKRTVESFSDSSLPAESVPTDLNDDTMMEVWSTPPEALDSTGSFERTCNHVVEQVTLAQVKERGHCGVYHIQAQVQSYKPQRLHQSLKLFCQKCQSLQDIPDDETLGALFSEAQKDAGSCSEGWTFECRLDVSGGAAASPHRTLTLLLPSRPLAEAQDLVFIKGASLDDICRISAGFRNVVPVTSSEGRMTLLDLSAPFLFCGAKRYYGCKQCSQVKLTDLFAEEVEALDVKTVAEALGVQLLQYGLLVTLELQDHSGSLEALVWRDAETFFTVSPEEAAANQDAQDKIQRTMDKLCPPGSRMAERPWLDLCVRASAPEDSGQRPHCYQIYQSSATVSTQHTEPA